MIFFTNKTWVHSLFHNKSLIKMRENNKLMDLHWILLVIHVILQCLCFQKIIMCRSFSSIHYPISKSYPTMYKVSSCSPSSHQLTNPVIIHSITAINLSNCYRLSVVSEKGQLLFGFSSIIMWVEWKCYSWWMIMSWTNCIL